MKKYVVVLIFLISTNAFSQDCTKVVNLDFIKYIESRGNSKAINPGMTGKAEDISRGTYQITEICMKEYNRKNNAKLTIDSLWNEATSLKVAKWMFNVEIPRMLTAYKLKHSIDNKIICYNAGINFLVKKKPIPEVTKAYIKQYKKLCSGKK